MFEILISKVLIFRNHRNRRDLTEGSLSPTEKQLGMVFSLSFGQITLSFPVHFQTIKNHFLRNGIDSK